MVDELLKVMKEFGRAKFEIAKVLSKRINISYVHFEAHHVTQKHLRDAADNEWFEKLRASKSGTMTRYT
jgi:hypothetical protein